MKSYEYCIGTGWWYAHDEQRVGTRRYWGSDIIRSVEFHHLWSAVVDGYCSPKMVFIVDSAAKQKPPITNQSYQMMSLIHNPGHAVMHTGHYSGWTASVLHSLEYALSNDVDYLVYVEQDALMFGEGVIEHCISKMRKPFMFGSGKSTPQPIQQSFFIIRNDGIRKFLARFHAIISKDKVISPEWKFVMASVGLNGKIAEYLITYERLRMLIHRCFGHLMQAVGYDELPIGFGRCRPIDFDAPYFYFQHGSLEELRRYAQQLPGDILNSLAQRSPQLADVLSDERKNINDLAVTP